MNSLLRRNRLLARMLVVLLPAGALPLCIFGILAIKSHFESLGLQSERNRATMARLMAGQLENDVGRTLAHLAETAAVDALPSGDRARIRAALARLRAVDEQVARAFWLDTSGVITMTEPPMPEDEGKLLDALSLQRIDTTGLKVGYLVAGEDDIPRFFAAQTVKNARGETAGYLAAEVELRTWISTVSALLRYRSEVFAAVLPAGQEGVPLRLGNEPDDEFSRKILAIRQKSANTTEIDIDGARHRITYRPTSLVPARIVLAEPESKIFAAPRRVVVSYFAVMLTLLAVVVGLLVVLVRSVSGRIETLVAVASEIGSGRLEARTATGRRDEIGRLAEALNQMGDSLQASHLRMRVMSKSVMELFSCNDVDELMKKGVELVCTQCLGDVAWFLPTKRGRAIRYSETPVFVGLHGWVWRNHHVTVTTAQDAAGLWRRVDGDRVFVFEMKAQGQVIGVLRVAYRANPNEQMISLLHALVSLIETAIYKQEQIRRGALISTELDMAEAVQRNVMSDNALVSRKARLAYHYQPASRLSGDWFYLIEDVERDRLFVIMGDVTGQGLSQGLVTTAVKGALDVVEHMVKRPEGHVVGRPSAIVALLETVVRRVATTSSLHMSCLVAEIDFKRLEMRVCNAGHTFPILVREDGGVKTTRHLHKSQQPRLGFGGENAQAHAFEEASYQLQAGDLMLIYTDGLSDAKNLSSGIFGRFLFRSLRKSRDYKSAVELKDEILEMFRYYTQDSQVEDDVCFLVVQIKTHADERESNAS